MADAQGGRGRKGDDVIAAPLRRGRAGARESEHGAGGEPAEVARVERRVEVLSNEAVSPLFLACVEATEEAVYNSLLKATTVRGRAGNTAEALPVERTVEILRKYNALAPGR